MSIRTLSGKIIKRQGRISLCCCPYPSCCYYDPQKSINFGDLPEVAGGHEKIPEGESPLFGGYYRNGDPDSDFYSEIRVGNGGWEIVEKRPNGESEVVFFQYCLFADKFKGDNGILDNWLDNYKTTFIMNPILGNYTEYPDVEIKFGDSYISFEFFYNEILMTRVGLCKWEGYLEARYEVLDEEENPTGTFNYGTIYGELNYSSPDQNWTAAQGYLFEGGVGGIDTDVIGGIKYPFQNTPVGNYVFNDEFVMEIF